MSAGRPGSHVFVILGGTGDLAAKKLLPSLFQLAAADRLGERYAIVAVGRRSEIDDGAYRDWVTAALSEAGLEPETTDRWCRSCLFYQPVSGHEGYPALGRRLEEIERSMDLPGDRVFYLALPPAAFPGAVSGLGEAGLAKGPGATRLVIEKPFGSDLASARELNALIHRYFEESQLYRIDHFLGKETVQNLLVFRFANVVFESLWNRERVESVQITVAEDIGVDGRAGYYDRAGALRDMVQNHLTQLLSLAAMEVPVAYEADAVRYEKVKALRAVVPIRSQDVVFGQYAAGRVGEREVPGYREEAGVDGASRTETFVALRLAIDNWRWQGVPFFLRTGKRLPRRLTQIAVTFRRPPVRLFESLDCQQVESNVLMITLQPDEGFALYFDVKSPGEPLRLEKLPLHFRYGEAFGRIPDAYETLLLDVLDGDQTLFVHAEEVEASWRLYEPLLVDPPAVEPYAAGSWGPAPAEELLARDGHRWRRPADRRRVAEAGG